VKKRGRIFFGFRFRSRADSVGWDGLRLLSEARGFDRLPEKGIRSCNLHTSHKKGKVSVR
jgi:hypothetical protein